jgi:hypothetical protein
VSESPLTAEYRQRLAARAATLAVMERRNARIAGLRIALGLGGVALLIWLGLAPFGTLVSIVALFAVIAIGHGRLINARDRARSAVAFYQRGLARMNFEWVGTGDPGDRFLPTQHLYAADLDLFGQGSLFQLLATCRTEGGRATLARWMLSPAAPDEILARQEAIRELVPDLDLREQLAVEGDDMRAIVDPAPLRAWAVMPRQLPGVAVEALVRFVPVLVIASLIWRNQGGPITAFLAAQGLVGLVALALRPQVRHVIDAVGTASRDLDVFVGVARIMEGRTDASARLTALRTALNSSSGMASSSIARLSQWVALLNSRNNVIFAPLAGLLMWATHCAFFIERWRGRHGHEVPAWLDAVAEFDALSALAGFAAEHPGYVFPTLTAPPSHLEATALGHPLMRPDAVTNDVRLGGTSPSLLIVSGSNMSGKSTFLRAIGANVVLAQIGAPVRAASFRLSPLAVGASIRVLDSLQEGHSRFYAEILRLKHVVDLARETNGSTLFLLDEVLSGTNSHDRRQGAEGLLRGLIGFGAIGLATTHDLALGAIAEGWSPQATNVHFADKFDGGSLEFDYTLRPGPVKTSNAIALMRSIGLDVDQEGSTTNRARPGSE